MTDPRSTPSIPVAPAPTTESGRLLAARARRESWGNWEGIAQFEIPAIEAEARRATIEQVRTTLLHQGYAELVALFDLEPSR